MKKLQPMLSKLMIVFLAACFAATSTQAKWYEASSEHFVIYADQSEKDVRRFAENLERYHAALVYMRKFGDKPAPSPSNRLTIFVTDGVRDVGKLYGNKNRAVAGFYIARAGGSIAFTTPIRTRHTKRQSGFSRIGNPRQPDFSQTVLLHEYAHHYMISNLPIALPRWYTEGFAEFFGTTTFSKDGSIDLGRPAAHRVGEINYAKSVPWKLLFNSRAYAKKRSNFADSFYGQSWAVFHYLNVTPEGEAMQLEYLKRLLKGEREIDAATSAFGDLKTFGRKIDGYLRRGKFSYFPIAADKITIGEVKLRKLSAGEEAIMPLRMRSKRGANDKQAAELVVEARKIAAKFPDDADVYSVLAEAEFDAGNDDAAIAAADKSISIDPKQINAMVQKGYALFRKAQAGEPAEEIWSKVRDHFLAINKIEANHPIPLYYYYRTYLEQGIKPTKNATAAIDWALQLAPFDRGLRFMAARQDMTDGLYADARYKLLPLAYDPHRSESEDGPVFTMLRLAEEKLGIREIEVDSKGNAVETAKGAAAAN